MRYVILVMLFSALFFLMGCVDNPPEEEATIIDCSSDISCMMEAASDGKRAKYYEYSEFGDEWSHVIRSCSNGVCQVDIKLEKPPSDSNPEVVAYIGDKLDMVCNIAIDNLGHVPVSINDCSGPYVDVTKELDELFEDS